MKYLLDRRLCINLEIKAINIFSLRVSRNQKLYLKDLFFNKCKKNNLKEYSLVYRIKSLFI
jgi:hypothetical protein